MSDQITKNDVRQIKNMLLAVLLEQNNNHLPTTMKKIHEASIKATEYGFTLEQIFEGDITVLPKKEYKTPHFGK